MRETPTDRDAWREKYNELMMDLFRMYNRPEHITLADIEKHLRILLNGIQAVNNNIQETLKYPKPRRVFTCD